MNDAPTDRRRIFNWRGPADAARLTDVIAEACAGELFELDGALVWLQAGQLIPVNRDLMREIVSRHVAAVRLVERGTFGWQAERHPFAFAPGVDVAKEPDERVLIDLINGLMERVARGPSAPVRL